MELDLQEWLMLILGFVIVGVLAHGFWVQYFGADRLPLKLDKQFALDPGSPVEGESLNQFRAELPNGGARIVTVGDSSIPVSTRHPSVNSDAKRAPSSAAAANLGQDSAETNQGVEAEAASSEASGFEQAAGEIIAEEISVADVPDQHRITESALDLDGAVDVNEPNVHAEVSKDGLVEGSKTETVSRSFSASAEVPFYVVLNVLGDIEGPLLLRELTALGFEFGDKLIFHRYDDEGQEKISLANAVEPGSFDPDAFETFSTPGVTMFMCASECQDARAVFEEMLYAAVWLADEMGAKLCDDRRSIMSERSVAELRQQVQEYQFSDSR